ncbi:MULTISPECIES: hypothetical protein [Parabacteroides]|uniref:hypothetical protein n=1 Tax=Parabacteroides TaxID=375288 RepID=UPI000F00AACE|nr:MULTISPECIES: hypothetical protein [Parabacteroides]RHU28817.1 hypothetical protein DXD68_04870 [Parabacteroides sp. TM07-1AC]WFE83056.1 hypothetical protein P3L47_12940 [Parabacteroides chongii]
MKKISLILLTSFLLVACGAYKYLDLGMLTTGMTVAEVENLMGAPDRVLAVNKKDGYIQEVLEYRTARNEVYALEFWDNYLTGYEYLYDDVTYIPPVAPPMVFPDYGRPIYIYPPDHHPSHPNRPNRPGSNRPESNRPSRPESNRPSRPESSRPESSRPTTTRPQTKPAEVTRPSNSGSSNRTENKRTTNSRTNSGGRNGGRR